MRTIIAVAVQKGDTVRLESGKEVTVAKVNNATPIVGRITWLDAEGVEYNLRATEQVQAVKL